MCSWIITAYLIMVPRRNKMTNAGNTHLLQNIKGIWKKTLLMSGALFGFELLFVFLSSSATIQKSILRDMDDIPPVVNKMMGEGFMDAMLKYGLIAIGYIHPFMMVILVIFVFMAVSQVMTSQINSGTIGFTLSKPVSRKRMVTNLALISFGGMAVMTFSAFLATSFGIQVFLKGGQPATPFISVAWNLFTVMMFVGGYVVLFAVYTDSGKTLFTRGGVVILLLYIFSLGAGLWEPFNWFSPINPFSYYKPMNILMGNRVDLNTSLMLLAVSAAMFGTAAFLFSKRDISSG